MLLLMVLQLHFSDVALLLTKSAYSCTQGRKQIDLVRWKRNTDDSYPLNAQDENKFPFLELEYFHLPLPGRIYNE